MRSAVAVALCLVVLAFAERARAAGACDEATSAWLEHCASRHALTIELVACPARALVVRDRTANLDVEIAPEGPRSFRRVAGIGVSPVGEFADWEREPISRRRALDDLVLCVSEERPPLAASTSVGSDAGALRRGRPPWLILAAACLLVAAATRSSRRAALADAGIGLALSIVAGLARALLLPRAFLHQNGQGPAWVGYALRDDVGMVGYGPGYPELCAGAARLGRGFPEHGVFVLLSLLGAVVPACWYLVARRLGATRWPALGIASVAVLDPVLGRVAQSESYFGAIVALTSLAMLAVACAGPRLRSWSTFTALLAAGLFASAAARVHPVGWPALALIPLPALFGLGSARRRLRLSLFAAIAIAAIVLSTSSGELRQILSGALGQRWAPRIGLRWEALGPALPLLLAPLALIVLSRSWRGVAAALSGVLIVAGALLSNWLGDPNPLVAAAYRRLWAPALAVVLGAAMARVRPSRVVAGRFLAAALMALGGWLWVTRATLAKTLPTDVLEAEFLVRERARFSPGAVVAYVERAGDRVTVLPLYDGLTASRVPLRVDEPPQRLSDLPKPAYYVRTSLCSSSEARARCAALEQSAALELVSEIELPARPSMRWHPYDTARVPVRIWAVH
jgi:hypothetical protein